ncbi:DnaJ domain-containing protein [Hypoxylon rubiginosum]|uniref:DnaJ domain-containing protein n=1 Tax=Hypoxylon rubiginosum TaxID=110542 RepID=A0ACC0DC99_9PEZI|nr:DnaJ domain-containing protein [Hypoxylon rubiginosum]
MKDIKDSYRRLDLANHPDKNPENAEAATAAFQKIQLAYETLSDPERRSEYDAHTSSAQVDRQMGEASLP